MIVDRLDNFATYFKSKAWAQVFEYLNDLSATSNTGKFPLGGDSLIVNVDAYRTKPLQDCVLETHEKYVDIQLLLDGEEYIDVYPSTGLEIKDCYDPERDVAFYHVPNTEAVRVKLVPGNFTVLFPQDAHSPQIAIEEPCAVKKVVVKIASALLFD